MSVYLIARNVFSNLAVVALSGLVGFVLTPILFHYLQPGNYALLVFALAAANVVEALDLGLGKTLVRVVSDLASRRRYADLSHAVNAALYFLTWIGILGAILLAAVSPLLAILFHARGTPSCPGYLVVSLVGVSVAFKLPAGALRGFLEGCQDFHLANAAEIVSLLLKALLTLIFVYAGFGLLAIAALFAAADLLRLVGMLALARRAAIPFRPSFSGPHLPSLRRIWSFASLSFIQDTATTWYRRADVLLAARLLPFPELAILDVARRFPTALTQLTRQPLSVAYPIVSSAAARGDLAAMKKFMLISTRNLLALALPTAGALFVWAGVILRLWVGEEVLSGVPVFRAFLVFAVMASLQESPLTLLYGMGRIRFSAGLSVVTLAVAVGLGTLACSGGGLAALAVVYASIQGIVALLLCYQALKLAELEPAQWLKKSVVPAVLAEVPTVAWFLLSYRLLPDTLGGLAISVVPGILLFFGLLLRLISGPERQPWRRRLKKLLAE